MGLAQIRGPDLWWLQLYLFTPGGRGPGRGWDHDIPRGKSRSEGKETVGQAVETQVTGKEGESHPKEAMMGTGWYWVTKGTGWEHTY